MFETTNQILYYVSSGSVAQGTCNDPLATHPAVAEGRARMFSVAMALVDRGVAEKGLSL